MPTIIHPATLAFDASGTPFSEKFADVYHSAQSGPEQARHVFLGGNRIPSRWAGRRSFTIVETGFGLGLNFMATWAAWRSDSRRCGRLHFVSVERHPFVNDDLGALHARYPEFSAQSAAIRAAWPPAVAGMHRLHLDQGRVTLTLVFADVLDALRGLRLGADAFYLDGFAPDHNPEMWSPAVMRALARLARPGATVATYTTARAVRDGLASAGFAVEKSSGFGRKREMLEGDYEPRSTVRHRPAPSIEWPQRKALIIGAGLAGAAIAERLATRDWQVDVLDRNSDAGRGASGLYAGAVQPHLSIDDCILSRFTRACFLYAHARRRQANGGAISVRAPCGVLQIADDAAHEERMADALAGLAYAPGYAQRISRGSASARAGRPVSHGGWWLPLGDWARPRDVVAAHMAAAAHAVSLPARALFHRAVSGLRRVGDAWSAIDAAGVEIGSAPVVVLANACDAARLVDMAPPALQRVGGQLTIFPEPTAAPRVVVCGRGYVLPEIDGYVVAGASYDSDDLAIEADAVRHRDNLSRADRLLPGIAAQVDWSTLRSEVGVRCIAPDRMPMVGAIVDMDRARTIAASLTGAHVGDIPRLPGLFCATAFGSRGLSWTALAGECLASQIEGEPSPLESTLIDAIDPGRFAVKRARAGMLR
ncbi:MAG: bifunctional tRNA (5-methylaminomethyl-2-thiouridine)(34)-methyltransferase MnmD/FAD-dependent 5-carboxymethylaminomethyl-2-thiouridine(34) oxidoreductase MnmC [Pseudomonadota bacterium]|nr:bifunctional tRNA (5-methylaminomethyl-2-thiouridine)(34)-methyltransferase MnmD/FAD-dependent 5-carboxymethylaminomethyl-2-thiouridine(34) oxidoreductase MnmC [Pseudomonadota bacterium]